jgi:predicted GNAT family N-acyltransferase
VTGESFTVKTIGYFRLNGMTDNKDKTGLSQAVLKQRLKKEAAKVECLVKAIKKHKESAPDKDIRICDQNLWSAEEMINYGG